MGNFCCDSIVINYQLSQKLTNIVSYDYREKFKDFAVLTIDIKEIIKNLF